MRYLLLPVIVLLCLINLPEPPDISTGQDRQLRVTVGPPDASLAVWVLQPPKGTPVKGTVLVLHGFLGSHRHVVNVAEALRESGYRSVLVDLRGWGDSTGTERTFGIRDATDLEQLVTQLQAQRLCGKTLGVYGTSMGASIAILYAAHDPRVRAVIAVAPFADIREEVPSFGRNVFGRFGDLFADATLNTLANMIADVSHMDLDNAKPIDAIAKLKIPLLLIHGDADTIIPHTASEKLHAADPAHSELVTIKGAGHLDLCFDPRGILQPQTREWFDATLAR